METIIDIALVKEQLKLLGHDVADDVIMQFVKGLNQGSQSTTTGAGAQTTSMQTSKACTAPVGHNNAFAMDVLPAGFRQNSQGSSKEAAHHQAVSATQAHGKSGWGSLMETDVAPSQMQQAPDQQSPKRLPAAASQHRDKPPTPSAMQQATLDQRCRNFLSRCSEQPSPQNIVPELLQQKQKHNQEQHQQVSCLQRPLLFAVRQPQQHRGQSLTRSSSQLSASSSSELLLKDATQVDHGESDDADSSECMNQSVQATAEALPQPSPGLESAPTRWWQHQQQLQHQEQSLLRDERHCSADHDDDDETYSTSSSNSGCSSLGVEAGGSKFLLHQAATMQRVRARLAAKMAGYTAAATEAVQAEPQLTAHEAAAQTACHAEATQSAAPGHAAAAAAAAAATARLVAADSKRSVATDAVSSYSRDASGPAAAADATDADDLPRYGFRPGYRPVGVHMPPPPSTAAVEALAAARALRQQAAAATAHTTAEHTAAAAATGSRNIGVKTATQQRLDLPLHMHSLSSAAAQMQLQQQLQQVQKQSRPEPVLLPSGGSSNSLQLGGSPGKPACASVVAARSSASIIGGDTPPCLAGAGSRSRQSPVMDPLYMAPLSPRHSNPATPRSSPARSPAPLAPLSAVAVGLGLARSPWGSAPAAAVAAGRASSAGGSRPGHSASAARSGTQVQAGKQQQGAGLGARRSASAPATPVAAAPVATSLRGHGSGVSVISSGGGTTANASSSRSRSGVSHESLYCQRLAYSSQRSTVAPGVRKTDRVARFQQMQQQWQRDRFLCSGAGGAAAKKASGQQGHL